MAPIPSQAVLQELESVVSSTGFAGAGRLVPFLRFLVERALAGDPVKESVIGVEVFLRPADYDPRVDPIVRVEARRLRSRLAEYYEKAGASDPVVIQLPKGAYVPVFERREPASEPLGASAELAQAPVPRRFGSKLLVGSCAVAIIAAAAFLLPRGRRESRDPVVAVLPFVNMSDDKSAEYFSDGLSEELIDHLAKVAGLRVVARSSSFQYKGNSADLREIGRKLNATAVVEGSVRRAGDRLRVTAQLIDVTDGLHLWSETYERRMSDVFVIQDDISRSIAGALRVELHVGFSGQAPPPAVKPEAYDLYLKGRQYLNHNALAGLELAAESFERATAADPGFATARSALALDYGLLGYYMLRPPEQTWPKAKAEAQRAIALDSHLGTGHAALGFALGMFDWRWAEAERELRKAQALEPNSADVHAALGIAVLLPTGRLPEATAELTRALEFDPQSYLASIGLGYALLAAGRYHDAIAKYRRAVEINPAFGDAQWDLGMAYAFTGDKDAAMRQFRLAGAIRAGSGWQPGAIEYALTGDMEAARKRIAIWGQSAFPDERPIFVAYCYGVMGEASETASWIEKAVAVRDPQVIWLKVDPRFAKVRSDPRIAALLRRIGL